MNEEYWLLNSMDQKLKYYTKKSLKQKNSSRMFSSILRKFKLYLDKNPLMNIRKNLRLKNQERNGKSFKLKDGSNQK